MFFESHFQGHTSHSLAFWWEWKQASENFSGRSYKTIAWGGGSPCDYVAPRLMLKTFLWSNTKQTYSWLFSITSQLCHSVSVGIYLFHLQVKSCPSSSCSTQTSSRNYVGRRRRVTQRSSNNKRKLRSKRKSSGISSRLGFRTCSILKMYKHLYPAVGESTEVWRHGQCGQPHFLWSLLFCLEGVGGKVLDNCTIIFN